jgi:oligoribonuclease NrnB/cAMP/cGMP phosphodiesterase (DHH superfamily)
MIDNMNFKNVYHISDNDWDGVSALYVSELAFGETVKTVASNVRKIDEVVQKYVENKWNKDTLLLITDLSIESKELADVIDQKVREGYSMLLIDHHPTAFWLNEYSWATVTNVDNGVKTCATTMLYDYLVKNGYLSKTAIVNDYVELVRQYDTWDWWYVGVEVNGEMQPNYRSKKINDLLWIIGRKSFGDRVLSALKSDGDVFNLTEREEYLLEVEQYRIDEYIKKKKAEMKLAPFSFEGREYQMAVMVADKYVSELGNVICKEREDIDFAVMIDIGKLKISFRATKEDVNTGLIAKSFGGGGHAPASGCDLDVVTTPVFLQPLFEFPLG